MIQVTEIVDTTSPDAVFKEIESLFIQFYPDEEFFLIKTVFRNFLKLFKGNYPGYRACNTKYHDIDHTTDALLAFSRLIDGHNLSKKRLAVGKVKIGLISTILHDSGYIQKEGDTTGTGAKYTASHVERSIDFIGKYLKKAGLHEEYFLSAKSMVECTALEVDISEISFPDSEDRILGIILGTADLIGQIASRDYIEKLIYLYREFREGDVQGYESELDLLKKSVDFYYNTAFRRLDNSLEGMYKLARIHFLQRYNIDKNLYLESMERNLEYLKMVTKLSASKFRKKLRRKIPFHSELHW